MIITNNLLALGHCSVGVACRSFLSLCRFPPPSLSPSLAPLGHLPPRGIYSVILAFSLGREQLRKLRLATQGCTPLRGCRVANSLRSPCHPTTPSLRCSPPPPSLAFSVPPPSLGQKAVFGTAAQSQAFFVRCRLRRPLGATGTLNYKYEGGDPQPLPSYL